VNRIHQVRIAEKRLQQIMRLLDRGALDQAHGLLEGAQEDFRTWPNGSGMQYIRARLEEEGAFRRESSEVALDIFTDLALKRDEFLGEALVGRARLLYRIDKNGYMGEIISLCNEAIELEHNPRAMMMLGRIFENDRHDCDLANQWYLSAYRHGSPWGVRSYASVQAKRHKLFRSMLAHVVATISAPFMAIRFGLSCGPFK